MPDVTKQDTTPEDGQERPSGRQLPVGVQTAVRVPNIEKSSGVGAPRTVEELTRQQKWRGRARSVARWLLIPYDRLPLSPRGRWERIALALAILMGVGFAIFFWMYSSAKFDAHITNAEDMGIMDQALWTTTHGSLLHQTICNPISDTNCLGDVSRFAIHFEPLMLVLSLLYVVVPSPKALLLLQGLVVASGSLPAYWIAARRLRSPLAGLCFAAAYLMFPALHSAVLFDFHAVTLAAAFLLFALYFMLTRNNVGLIIACVLAMATKEEIPLDVFMIGLAILGLQRRRIGAWLMGLAVAWVGMAVFVMRMVSPVGHSPTASRYAYLGSSPLQAGLYILTHPLPLLLHQVLPNGGDYYLRTLLTPMGYLDVLSPQTWLLAAPALLLNLLSSDPNMHTGIHQYSAEIVPFMVFSGIAGAALVLDLVARAYPLLRVGVRRVLPQTMTPALAFAKRPWDWGAGNAGWAGQGVRWSTGQVRRIAPARVALMALLVVMMFLAVRQQFRLAYLPVTKGFTWPQVTQHDVIGDRLMGLIPPTASVCAQDTLVPHLSHRTIIYQFPYRALDVQYIMLDAQGKFYPFTTLQDYTKTVNAVLMSGRFHIVARQDGYLLLARNAPAELAGQSTAAAAPGASLNALLPRRVT